MSVQKKSSIRNSHKMNKIKEINKIDNFYEENDLANFVIKPTKIKKERINIKDMADKRDDEQENEYEEIKKNKKMVNNPYKGIIPKKMNQSEDPDLNYELDYNKKIEEQDDLVVYKIKEDDKNKQKFDEKFNKFEKKKKHDDKKLKKIYSETEKAKHLEKFNYNHKYKYSRVGDNEENTDDDLRTDRIEYYKKEQQKAESQKMKVDNIFNELIESGAISEDFNSIDIDQIDIEELENKIKEIGGEEFYEKMLEENT